MATKNDITGDLIQSKLNNKAFEDNFDRIFRKTPELWTEEDEKRQDIVGQNGNVGYDLEEMYTEGENDYGA